MTENDDKVLLDPPLIALDKDAPLRYAGEEAGLNADTLLDVQYVFKAWFILNETPI